MAIIDLPTTAAFRGAQFSLGLDVSESTYTGFLTGNRTRRSNLADRLRATLTLPPCKDRVAGAAREALLMGLRSNGDWLRMGMPHRAQPLGNLRGTLLAAATAAAGARVLRLSGATAAPNMLTHSGLETDLDANDLDDGWLVVGFGAYGTLGVARVAGNGSTWGQTVFASALGPTNSDIINLSRAGVPVLAGQVYTLAADTKDTTCAVALEINWYTAGNVYLSSSGQVFAYSGSTWTRRIITATAPATAAKADIYISGRAQPGGPTNGAISVDNVQLEAAASASAFAGLPTMAAGDWLGVGGNLVQCAWPGVVATDAGVVDVPLAQPLPRAVSSGAAVTWSAPTGLWELDDDGLQLDYSPGVLQGGVAIPLRQVMQ